MMAALVIVFLIITSIVLAVELNHASAEGKISPIDEPNFKPTITKVIENGKHLEIIEFKSKIRS